MSISAINNCEALYPVENTEAAPVCNQIISSSSSDIRTKAAAGAVLMATGVEAVAASVISGIGLYAGLKVAKLVATNLVTPMVGPGAFKTVIQVLESSAGIVVASAAALGCIALAEAAIKPAQKALKAGKVKLENAVGPEAVKTADIALLRLPSGLKSVAGGLFIAANFAAITAITAYVFEISLLKGAGLGIPGVFLLVGAHAALSGYSENNKSQARVSL